MRGSALRQGVSHSGRRDQKAGRQGTREGVFFALSSCFAAHFVRPAEIPENTKNPIAPGISGAFFYQPLFRFENFFLFSEKI